MAVGTGGDNVILAHVVDGELRYYVVEDCLERVSL